MSSWCDLQLQGCLPHLSLVIATADCVHATVFHSNPAKDNLVALHLESLGGSFAQSVLNILSQGRVRGDCEGQGRTTTCLYHQIVIFQKILWRYCNDKMQTELSRYGICKTIVF